MRVTAQVKEETHAAILDAARKLFLKHGVDGTSTRDIAKAAGLGVGTLFNYFDSKENLAMALVAGVLAHASDAARRRIERDAGKKPSLEMDLFTLVASNLRELKGLRPLIAGTVDGALGRSLPERDDGGGSVGIRGARIADAEWVLTRHGVEAGAVLMHLYWSLYLGVLSFWSRDTSPAQEDTLAVLDQAVRMFTSVAAPGSARGPSAHGGRP